MRTPEAHHLYGAALYLAKVSNTSVPNHLPWGYLSYYGSELQYRAVRKTLSLP